MVRYFFPIFGLVLLTMGCASVEDHSSNKTDNLRQLYPAGITSREDVQKRWAPTKPDNSEIRPAGGWSAHSNTSLSKKLQAIESTTGKTIFRVERYWGLDRVSTISLSYCWFYYDADDKIVDVEWQYKSD